MRYLFLLIAAFTLQNTQIAEGSEKGPVYLMGVLGDSISAGSSSNLNGPKPHPIENGFELSSFVQNKTTWSWASGKKIKSHFLLLQEYLERTGEKGNLHVKNLAIPGGRTRHLMVQVKHLVRAAQSGKYAGVKYITLMIGSADACTRQSAVGTPDPQMKRELLSAFKKLAEIQQPEPLRILVSSLPRIPDLGQPFIRDSRTILGLSCRKMQDRVINLCAPLLQWRDSASYLRKLAVIEDKNQLLKSVVEEVNARYPNLDVVFSGSLYEAAILPQMLAFDCFHPSQWGQSELSKHLWEDQPWFK